MHSKLLLSMVLLAALTGCMEDPIPKYTGPQNPPTPTPPSGCIGTISCTNETLKGEAFLVDFRGTPVIVTTFDNIMGGNGQPVATVHLETPEGTADSNRLLTKNGAPGNFQSYAQDVAAYAATPSGASQLRMAYQAPKLGQPVWLYTSSGKDKLFLGHVAKLDKTSMQITFENSPDGVGHPGQPIVDANGDVVGIFLAEAQSESSSIGHVIPLQVLRSMLEAR